MKIELVIVAGLLLSLPVACIKETVPSSPSTPVAIPNLAPTPTPTYTLNVSIGGKEGGSVSLFPPGGIYEAGTQVTLTATPASGVYLFDHWEGDVSGSSSTVNITMNSNKHIIAYFKNTQLTIPPSPQLVYPRQISLEEANKIMNAVLPVPAYLPQNYSLTAIYALEHSDLRDEVALTFYPKGSEDRGITNMDRAPIRMYVRLFRGGQIGGLKLVGERYDIGGTTGILVTRSESNDLVWILNYREFPGQYEMVLAANKDMPKEELVMIARSVPNIGWTSRP